MRTSLPLLSSTALLIACGQEGAVIPKHIGIVVPEGFFVTEVTAPFDVYSHAGDLADVFLVGETLEPITGYYGEVLYPDYTFDDAPPTDVLVVPSGAGSMEEDLEDDAYLAYIRQESEDADFVTSHCWGAFALGAAGVLDGKDATTFPGYTEALDEKFEAIDEIVDDRRWVQDENVITSNGGMAAFEASLYVVEELFGAEEADAIADGLVFTDENRDYVDNPRITSVPGSSEAIAPLPETKNVAILIMDGLFVTEAVAPYDVYAHAGESLHVYFVAATRAPIVGHYGERLAPHYTFADAPQADVLVIPSGDASMDADLQDQEMLAWVAEQAAGADYVTSNCWGAFTLAAAGLLDGRSATTFPGYFDELRGAFSSIGEVVEDARIVRDGHVITSNGGLAAYESALYVVQELFGPTAGDIIAGGLVFSEQNLQSVREPYVAR
ncbi:MAG TPA: DJ-1/PfpI family protein [Myxococcota bacterium]|nr:DJ-1/PfpI family protein [Myxococcota bacterium]